MSSRHSPCYCNPDQKHCVYLNRKFIAGACCICAHTHIHVAFDEYTRVLTVPKLINYYPI